MVAAIGVRSRKDCGNTPVSERITMGVEFTIIVSCCWSAVSIRWAIATPPPPPDRFSYDALSISPAPTSARPVPRAVPSQPPPAPPGIRKWMFDGRSCAETEAPVLTARKAAEATAASLVPFIKRPSLGCSVLAWHPGRSMP